MLHTSVVTHAALSLCLVVALAGCSASGTPPAPTHDCSSARPYPSAEVDWCVRWRSVGYELHITRAEDWSLSSTKPIPMAEWEGLARAEERLIEDGVVEFAGSSPAAAFVWRDSRGPSFWWRNGQINIKGVRSEVEIGEIVTFAKTLGAAVRGDDGETYDEQGGS